MENNNLNIKKILILVASVIICNLIFFVGVQLVMAQTQLWQEPVDDPPGGGMYTFLNTSPFTQTKTGNLALNMEGTNLVGLSFAGKMQLRDEATGKWFCVFLHNGAFQFVEGACSP